MRRTFLLFTLSACLVAYAAGSAFAQSRTVSTADMPKPGVSYISGPGAPVRKETVSTGSLPQPARLYVGGQATANGNAYASQGGGYSDGGYASDEGGYYGNYPPGYYGNGGYGRDGGRNNGGRRGDHDGRGNDGYGDGGRGDGRHDHGQRPSGNSATLALGSGGNVSGGGRAPLVSAPPSRGGNGNNHDYGNGYGNNSGADGNRPGSGSGYHNAPPVQPLQTPRPYQPGTGSPPPAPAMAPTVGVPARVGGGYHGR